MRKKTRELIEHFRPQFGNTNHIRALAIIDKIHKRETLKKKKSETTKNINDELEELDRDLAFEEAQLEFLLK